METGAEALKGLLPRTFQRAGDAAKDAAAKVDQAVETRRTLELLTEPTPRRGGAKAIPAEGPQPGADEIGRKVEELLQKNAAQPEAKP